MRYRLFSSMSALGALLLGMSGCVVLLDYGDYHDRPEGTGGTGGGSGGAAGSTGAGGDGMCAPNEVMACYSGSPETAGIGACKAGTRTCDPVTRTFGPCTGEVLPSAEVALNAVDEDCDGAAPGQLLWQKRLGDSADQTSRHVAIDGAGNVLITGHYQGTLSLGGGKAVGPAAEPDVFVAKIGADGTPLWIKDTGGSMTPRESAGLTVDPAGNITLAGTLTDASKGQDAFLLHLDETGAPVWPSSIGGMAADRGQGIIAHKDGSAQMIARFQGDIDLPDGPHSSAGGDDLLIVQMDTKGQPVWGITYGGERDDIPWAITLNEAGEGFITGEYRAAPPGMFDAGDKMVPEFSALFVMKTLPGGQLGWKKGFPSATLTTGNTRGLSIALDAEGAVWVTGAMYGDIDFGEGPLLYAQGSDVFLARLDGNLGQVLWARSFGDGADQRGTSVAVADDGSVFLAGTFAGTLDFDDATPEPDLTAKSEQDMFVVKLDSLGHVLWSARMALDEATGPRDVHLALYGGDLVLAGGWKGGLDFGTGNTLTPAGGLDVFVAKLSQ